MISPRQENIRGRLPRHHGHVKMDFKELDRMLYTYTYSDQELDVIEKGLVEVERNAALREAAKQRRRDELKALRKGKRI